MGNGSRIICKKEKQEWYCPQAYHSRFLAIPSAFVLLPGLPYSIPDVGGGQSPQKAINTMSYLLCKKTQKMYKIFSHGYTVNRGYLRQQQNHKFDSKILHIYFLSGRFIFQRHKNFYSLLKCESLVEISVFHTWSSARDSYFFFSICIFECKNPSTAFLKTHFF